MQHFDDIVSKTTKENGTYVFHKLRLYDRGNGDIVLLVELLTAPQGIGFEARVELTDAEAVSLAGGLLAAVEKKKVAA